MPTTEIIIGHDLSDAYVQRMSQQRITEYGENTKDFRKNELDSTFFFIHDDGKLCAFGMLKPVTLTHKETTIPILGIGNIIAIEKAQGYGRELMQRIRAYLSAAEKIGLGFCAPQLTAFYTKCGYQVVEQLSARFYYPLAHTDGTRERLAHIPNILCYDPEHRLINRLQASDERIEIDVPFW